ncbi:hypothetical protein Taro_055473 [Colocasia esculenta]|uniref:Uncharacterized protein n=1 Tax=Colocasia esculenta TaxID=4460 RepID=A0A843XTN7_COLES|nr:hypothetical protein [Colocasia esculenta]
MHFEIKLKEWRCELKKKGYMIKSGVGTAGEGDTKFQKEKVIEVCQEKDLMSSSEPSILSPILDVVCNGHYGGYERG